MCIHAAVLTAVRMSTPGADSLFRTAVDEHTTVVQVGYLTKPMAASVVTHRQGLFIHIASSLDWVCRTVTGKGRGNARLKGYTGLLDALTKITINSTGTSAALAEEEVDPMEELLQDDVCAGGRQKEDTDLITPKKRSRKKFSQAELEFITTVPLLDIIDDNIYP